MQQSFDLSELEARFQTIRHSEYFPAILGAVAGGLTGALMAALLAGGRRAASRVEEGETRSAADTKTGLLLGFSPRDLIQLATIVATLARQMREWQNKSQG